MKIKIGFLHVEVADKEEPNVQEEVVTEDNTSSNDESEVTE